MLWVVLNEVEMVVWGSSIFSSRRSISSDCSPALSLSANGVEELACTFSNMMTFEIVNDEYTRYFEWCLEVYLSIFNIVSQLELPAPVVGVYSVDEYAVVVADGVW